MIFSLNVDFLWREPSDLRLVQKVCERAVVSAAIVLVLFGRDHGSATAMTELETALRLALESALEQVAVFVRLPD